MFRCTRQPGFADLDLFEVHGVDFRGIVFQLDEGAMVEVADFAPEVRRKPSAALLCARLAARVPEGELTVDALRERLAKPPRPPGAVLVFMRSAKLHLAEPRHDD